MINENSKIDKLIKKNSILYNNKLLKLKLLKFLKKDFEEKYKHNITCLNKIIIHYFKHI